MHIPTENNNGYMTFNFSLSFVSGKYISHPSVLPILNCACASSSDYMNLCVQPFLGPCPQSNLKTTLDCNTNTAVASWTPGRGIWYYNASAESMSIIEKQTCSTNGSSCNITSLSCGKSYRVSVSGQGQICPSPAQDWNMIQTGNLFL